MTQGISAHPAQPQWWLVRHALPVLPDGRTPSQVCYGHTDWPADAALTEQAATGLAAAILGEPLADSATALPPPPKVVLRCSPLLRCVQLAQALQARLPACRVDVDARLAEMHFGRWEGVAWNDIPRHELDAWAANFAHCPVGHSGETVQAFVQRVAQAAQDTLAALHTPAGAARHAASATTTVWITHAGVIRAMHWLGRCPGDSRQLHRQRAPTQAQDWPSAAPGYGQWCRW